MSKASAAIQDLMRDTAHLLDQASKINTQLLLIDTFTSQKDMQALLAGLAQSRRQYKESLGHARNCAAELAESNTDKLTEQSDADKTTEPLQLERDSLHKEAVAKSEQLRRMLDCMRQIQLISAQLTQTPNSL
ncbi:hypothetical protein IWW50_002663 [Coemansia erecta]|nr:hypothetical protein IWW50_002663 [Coemansia erecta]